MEEAIKTSKRKPTKIDEMSKEQIRRAILKKRECNTKAQNIVECMLEKSISEETFLQCLPDINQSHFEDIIEERSIILLCGYPICPNTLSQKDIPKQKYKISVKCNKVYDITTRKSFCSNGCFQSAMFIKNQLFTSPLWFREYEEVRQYHLLPMKPIGILGQEIDVSITEKIKVESKAHLFTSINDFTNASLKDMDNANENKSTKDSLAIEYCEELNTNNSQTQEMGVEQNKTTELKLDSHEIKDQEKEFTSNNKSITVTDKSASEAKTSTQKKNIINPMNIVGEIIEKPERKIDPILSSVQENKSIEKTQRQQKKCVQKKVPAVTALTIEIEKCLSEWLTIDTLLFLFGDQKVKNMVADKGECIKEYLNNYSKSIFYNSNVYDQYQALCKKLNMLELEDRRSDSQIQRETKPLPDYSILQEESKKMQLKVKAFLTGETNIPESESIVEENPNPEAAEDFTQLPLVDKNAQNALRRKIVCQHLDKVLPDLLRSLGLLSLSISGDVRLLVNTLKLKANNVMFKPIQWTLIAIIFIKLLSLRDKRLEHLLSQPTAYQHMQLLLLSYQQDGGYLDRLISWLTDIDRLIDTCDTQLTV